MYIYIFHQDPGAMPHRSGNSGQLRTTPENSGQLWPTPANSGQLRTTPDNSGQLRTAPFDRSKGAGEQHKTGWKADQILDKHVYICVICFSSYSATSAASKRLFLRFEMPDDITLHAASVGAVPRVVGHIDTPERSNEPIFEEAAPPPPPSAPPTPDNSF